MDKTHTFSINHTQFLNTEGILSEKAPDWAKKRSELLDRYRWMWLTRLFDQKAVTLQRTGKLGTFPSSFGQEAVSVGIGKAMAPNDVFCPTYREQGALLQRGMSMVDIFTYWSGDERGNDFQTHREDLPICVPIATQCLHAAGIATAMRIRKEPRAVLVTCGDGATSKGDFYEAMNVAGAWQLPLVFVINNNEWAISVPREQQSNAPTLAQKGLAGGLCCEQVDGNDVVAVEHLVSQALLRARTEHQATVIEALTYRLSDHTTADDARRYRSSHDYDARLAKEPLLRLKKNLSDAHGFSDDDDRALQQTLKAEIDAAAQTYLARSTPAVTDMFDYVYAHLPESLAAQREAFLHDHPLD